MIVGIDPGRDKSGIALLTDRGRLVEKKVVLTGEVTSHCQKWFSDHAVTAIALGNGTHSEDIMIMLKRLCEALGLEIPISLVDEMHTTEMGLQRYWRYHPPHGWRKWIPVSWQKVPCPIDDYVAWIIGEKFLGNDMPEVLSYLSEKWEHHANRSKKDA